MKKLIFLLFTIITFQAISQDQYYQKPIERNNPLLVDGDLHIDSFYQNENERLIYSGVHLFDGVKQNELLKKVKNWAGTNFVNLKEVLVGETDDQLVLNYIISNYVYSFMLLDYNPKWYIRLENPLKLTP